MKVNLKEIVESLIENFLEAGDLSIPIEFKSLFIMWYLYLFTI